MPKSPIKSFKVNRVEGPIEACKSWELFPDETMTTDQVFQAAFVNLVNWGDTAPKPGYGYDKCDVFIIWENDENFKFRFDLQNGGTDCGTTIRESLRRTVRCYAGVECPDHLKPHWDHLLKRQRPEFLAAMKRIHETCEV